MFRLITDKLAERRARRLQLRLSHQEMAEKNEQARERREFEILASQAFMRHVRECQAADTVDVGWIEDEGGFRFFIGLWSFFNNVTKQKETHVEVTSIEPSKNTYLVVFSQCANRMYYGWWAEYRPSETSPSSPAMLRRAGGHLKIAAYTTTPEGSSI